MEALETFWRIGGESCRVVVRAEFERSAPDRAAYQGGVSEIDGADFPPEEVADLTLGRGCGDDECGGVGVGHEPPDDGGCGDEGLA